MKKAIYIHIPFCPTECKFCHFYINGGKRIGYIDLLQEEVLLRLGEQKIYTDCIHIGGGTPNLLSLDELDLLLKFVSQKFQGYKEFSIELHPALCSKKQLDILKKYGINRISFGIQTLDTKVLRLHTRVDANYENLGSLVHYAKEIDFKKINFDFIYDLIGDSNQNIQKNFDFIKKYKPTSVYYYRLRKFTDHLKKHHTSNEKRAFSYYMKIKSFFQDIGYSRLNNAVYYDKNQLNNLSPFLYDEIIYSTKHNLIGLGVAATSEIDNIFYKNPLRYENYEYNIIKKKTIHDLTFSLSHSCKYINKFYFYLLQKSEFHLVHFKKIFGGDAFLGEAIQKLTELGMIIESNNIIRLTEKSHYYFDEKVGDILFSEYNSEYELLKKL